MTIAKAVFTGSVYRAPEKRFTTNNVGVSAFIVNVEDKDMLIRVLSKRNALDEVVSSLSKGDKVVVEGRLQTANAKMEDGSERKIFELDAGAIEKMSGSSSSSSSGAKKSSKSDDEIVKFGQDEVADELIGEDEIPF